jgi:hypothetical protein
VEGCRALYDGLVAERNDIVSALAAATKNHFPELPKLHPELAKLLELGPSGGLASELHGTTQPVPQNWIAQPPDQNCMLAPIVADTPEFEAVKERMIQTMPEAQIVKLERVQNVMLWQYYCMRQERMRSINGKDPNEVSVWHGTRSHDPKLIYEDMQDGFMMQYCTGGMWGRGIYFAENASYSDGYSHAAVGGTQTVMLTKLLAGDEVDLPSTGSLKIPPPKPDGVRYDTVTGTTGSSKVYIVYENGRAYPEYVVTYKRRR